MVEFLARICAQVHSGYIENGFSFIEMMHLFGETGEEWISAGFLCRNPLGGPKA